MATRVKGYTRKDGVRVKGHTRKGESKHRKVGHRRRGRRHAPHEKHMKSRGFRHKLSDMMKSVHRRAGTRRRRRRA